MTEPRLLDLTRLVNRAGRVPTGVDRVERAYLKYIVEDETVEAFGLVRTALGYVLLDRVGLRALQHAVDTGDWGSIDLISRLNPRLSHTAKHGQSLIRRHALARTPHTGLSRLLKRLPDRFRYLNVGHSNLSQQSLQPFASHPGAEVAIMIHDAIPLDHPEMQRSGAAEAFEDKLRLVASYADRVICTSLTCLAAVRPHLERMGRVPPLFPAVLGIDVPAPEPLQYMKRPEEPYFVVVGTIEPRKNHSLLLDIWDEFAGDGPGLLICGHRGWADAALFERLDRGVPNVTEIAGLTDGEIGTLLKGSKGLLFPSFAEGFGLPPAEAAALGVPVVCSNLPSCREILGNTPVYLSPSDRYQWKKSIIALAGDQIQREQAPFDPPTWESHFKLVFSEAS